VPDLVPVPVLVSYRCRSVLVAAAVSCGGADRSFQQTLAPTPLPRFPLPFSPLHFSGTAVQYGTEQYSTVLGESHKKKGESELSVARRVSCGQEVLPEPRCPELELSPLPPRRPIAFSLSVDFFTGEHTTNTISRIT
jgi:hypothetical protein